MFKYTPELSIIKMGESETVHLHSFNNLNAIGKNDINSHNQAYSDGKKYKLRLKFDGACALEVVRLNGGHFQNLTHLDISGNSAEKLDLRSLGRLEWLCCSNNQLEVLTLSGTSLTYLDCSHNNLQSISVDPVPNNLSSLQASFNKLEELPPWTWMIPELFTIYASNNRIRQIDCKFQNCLSSLPIRELYLHCNNIDFVSKDFIQRATRLKILNISQNVVQLMPSFPRRSIIQELYMSRNKLEDTDDRAALDFLVECLSLRRLHLAFNKIRQISDKCITAWKSLEELVLCGNLIRGLSSKMSTLTNLRVLRLHSNHLEIAPNLTKMPALKVVDLSHNNIRKLNLENMISGGNLTYLDISCNVRLTLDPEKLNNPGKRPMNLVEVTNPRKPVLQERNNQKREFPWNPPWELGFSELPDRNQSLSISQYRDVNLSGGKSALFGLFDVGDGNPAPKSLTKSIAKIYAEERSIDDSPKFSLKYTLLNSLRNFRQQGNTKPVHGILCLLSTTEGKTSEKPTFSLDVAVIGESRCLLIQSGKKLKYIPDEAQVKKNFDHGEAREDDSTKSDSSNDISGESIGSANSSTIQDPYVFSVSITPATEYLVVANQSIWDHVNDKELLDEIERHRQKKSILIAKRLTDMAQSHSCKQSLSLILIRFKWHSSSSRGLIINRISSKDRMATVGEYGPMSYYSVSSDCSDDVANPLASVITPDSAIESDRSSESYNTNDYKKVVEKKQFIKTITSTDDKNTASAENVSLAGTSVSQMSVEQFRCWEYMLEQNTKLLFKKELDTLSKGLMRRNQKFRKSINFPYKQDSINELSLTSQEFQSRNSKSQDSSKSKNLGFYTIGKAKSLTNLFAEETMSRNSSSNKSNQHGINSTSAVGNSMQKRRLSTEVNPKSHFPLFTNANAGFLDSVRSTRGTLVSGPGAAYFSSTQRQMPHFAGVKYHNPISNEIQELGEVEETRLKKYWDNKITEL